MYGLLFISLPPPTVYIVADFDSIDVEAALGGFV